MEFSPELVSHASFKRFKVFTGLSTGFVIGVSGLVALAKSPSEIGWAILFFWRSNFVDLLSLTELAQELQMHLWALHASYQGLYKVLYCQPSFCGW
jgi:hypothetical protein